MVDRHALGPAGRARGVDQVGEALGPGAAMWPARLGRRHGRRLGRGIVQNHDRRRLGVAGPRGGVLEVAAGGSAGQDDPGAGVAHLEGEVLDGGVQVQRQVGTAGLQDGEKGDHQLAGSRQRHGHRRLRGDAAGDELGRQTVGALLELQVAPGLAVEDQRRRLGA